MPQSRDEFHVGEGVVEEGWSSMWMGWMDPYDRAIESWGYGGDGLGIFGPMRG